VLQDLNIYDFNYKPSDCVSVSFLFIYNSAGQVITGEHYQQISLLLKWIPYKRQNMMKMTELLRNVRSLTHIRITKTLVKEKFEDIKWVIRRCKSKKGTQYNNPPKRTKNYLQNITHQTKDRATRTPLRKT
jgi:hypothetical protein